MKRSLTILLFLIFLGSTSFSSIDEEKKARLKTKGIEEFFYKRPFFKLPSFSITIFNKNEVFGTMRIDVILKSTQTSWLDVREHLPLIYHNIFVDLYQSLNYLWDKASPPNQKILEKRFRYVIGKTIGEEHIDEILVGLVYFSEAEKSRKR